MKWARLVRDSKLCIERLVGQLRLGRGGPARAASEIVLQDRTIGMRLEVATRPNNRRFDEQAVIAVALWLTAFAGSVI